MEEFDAIAQQRSVAELLQDSLDSAEAQLKIEQRRVQRAQRRAQDLFRAVNNWQELIEDYEQATNSRVADRQN